MKELINKGKKSKNNKYNLQVKREKNGNNFRFNK